MPNTKKATVIFLLLIIILVGLFKGSPLVISSTELDSEAPPSRALKSETNETEDVLVANELKPITYKNLELENLKELKNENKDISPMIEMWENEKEDQVEFLKIIAKKHDLNEDGYLSLEESTFSKKSFSMSDTDNDGLLSKEEIINRITVSNTQKLKHLESKKDSIKVNILSMDINQDTVISAMEYTGGSFLFSRLDTNSDQEISNKEIDTHISQSVFSAETKYLKEKISQGYL